MAEGEKPEPTEAADAVDEDLEPADETAEDVAGGYPVRYGTGAGSTGARR